jgi:hypothetical protein
MRGSNRHQAGLGGRAGGLQPRSRLVQRAAIKLRAAECCCSHERPNLNNSNLNNSNLNDPNRRPMHLDC